MCVWGWLEVRGGGRGVCVCGYVRVAGRVHVCLGGGGWVGGCGACVGVFVCLCVGVFDCLSVSVFVSSAERRIVIRNLKVIIIIL